jgi:ABC-type uncharacterized transport system ATPase subunit
MPSVSSSPDHRHAASPSGGAAPPAVELIGITKAFPGVVANDDISFAVRHGEVHCLLGENGAGKSTLMSILAGMLRPDAGRIRVDGEEAEIDSPRAALRLGIGMVYQHTTLIGALSVLENLMLGETRAVRLDAAAARERLARLSAMLGVEIDGDTRAADLALGRQQQVEIVKALWRGSRVLILDEPTSMLTPQAVAELQAVLERLKGEGLAIVFITHKLHEARALADRVSILRAGRLVGSIDEDELHAASASAEGFERAVVRMMFGDTSAPVGELAELSSDLTGRETEPARRPTGDPVLELDRATAAGAGIEPGIEDVSFALHAGEVLGVAGVDGNGQRALAEAVSGVRPLTHGEIRLFGAPVGGKSVSARERLGLHYVTDDRLGEGIVSSLSVSVNLVLKRIGQAPFWRRGRIQNREIERQAQEFIDRFEIRTPGPDARAGTLSGGNVQKVVLARELSFGAKAVVFHKPTYGLDLKTTRTVRQMIRELAEDGKAALVISTDLDELLEVADRTLVLSRGRIVGSVENGPDAAERIGALMIGEDERR